MRRFSRIITKSIPHTSKQQPLQTGIPHHKKMRFLSSVVAALLLCQSSPALGFQQRAGAPIVRQQNLNSFSSALHSSTIPNYNGVEVAKTGGQGVVSASQKAIDQDLSLGAPKGRPEGGHFLTRGGIQVTANVEVLEFSKSLSPGTSASAIENLVEQLDSHRGVLLTSSYEFPGRYARWSLGFVDPPLEISGRADQCTIRALNERGKVLMPAIEATIRELKQNGILSTVEVTQDSLDKSANGESSQVVKIDATVVPPPEVGTFSEEERSRQVCDILFFAVLSFFCLHCPTDAC